MSAVMDAPAAATSAIALALNDAALCCAYLRELQAAVSSAGVSAHTLTPYIALRDPGQLPDVLDREQRHYHAMGRLRCVDLMGCVVTWTAEAAA